MYYFVSDIHLGLGTRDESLAREKRFAAWLESVSADADAIFIVGDLFDFWHEYRRVIPRGFSRLLGTLSALTDRGVSIHFFSGNHDMWAYDYLQTECGVRVHHRDETMELNGRKLYVAHGDDIVARRSNFLTRVMNGGFRSGVLRWMFARFLHPDFAMRLGYCWSSHSRKSKDISHRFLGDDEPMVRFAREYAASHDIDYFIFGHNHCAEVYPLNDKSTAVFLGEWIESPTYAVLDGSGAISLRNLAE